MKCVWKVPCRMEHAQSVLFGISRPHDSPHANTCGTPKKNASFPQLPLSQGVVIHLVALLQNYMPVGFWEIALQLLLHLQVLLGSNSAAAQENKTARNSQFRLQEDPEMILKCALLLIITLLCSNCGQRIGMKLRLNYWNTHSNSNFSPKGPCHHRVGFHQGWSTQGLLISSNACGPNNPLKEIIWYD